VVRPSLLDGDGAPLRRRLRLGPPALPVRNRLRVLRAERGWSQAELAGRLGVSRQTVNAIETEKYHPSLPLAFRIAALFTGRIEDVFTPDPASV
jgi:putative transcriptional regulator